MTIGVASLVVTVACGSCTSSSTTAPSASTLHAEVTDPVGDAVASAGVPKPPDLIHGTVDVGGGNVTFTIQFAAGTMDSQSTRLTVQLDTDQNVSTGIVGASGIGIDYILDMWTRSTQTVVARATPATCVNGDSCYALVGNASLGLGTDVMTATVPVTMLGNASGRLNYRVFAYASTGSTAPTVTADVMPDINLPPAHVP